MRATADAGLERRRLSLLVRVASSAGEFSPRLADAVDRATDAEIRILSDLVSRGMTIPGLVSVMQGAHVVVGDDSLYRSWIFPASRPRMSSHHRSIDKRANPDYGLDGPLVRESLHGRAVVGTWVQMERTPATFRWGRLPTWSDVIHIRDYLLYRLTGMNVGPWGLSAHVDTRPIVIRPPQATTAQSATRGLAVLARHRIRRQPRRRGDPRRWAELLATSVTPIGPAGDLFAAPVAAAAVDLVPDTPYKDGLGLGLFGALPIARHRVTLRPAVVARLDAPVPPPTLAAPGAGPGPQEVRVPLGPVDLQIAASTVPGALGGLFPATEEEDPT